MQPQISDPGTYPSSSPLRGSTTKFDCTRKHTQAESIKLTAPRWGIMTPFGLPVEPDVKHISFSIKECSNV